METLDREKLIKYQQKYESSNDQNLNLLMTKTGIKWIELLECAFDKRFLELDSFMSQLTDNCDKLNLENARSTLNEISSVFSQLIHKCLIVFDSNDKLQKEVDSVKKDLKFVTSERKLLEQKLENSKSKPTNELMNFNNYNSLNSRQMTNNTRLIQTNRVMSLSNVSRSSSLFNIKCNYPNQQLNESNYSEIYAEEEIANLRQDNISLKKMNISLKSELFGAKLAIKCLNKELTGRIQQIQILSKRLNLIILEYHLNVIFTFFSIF